VRACFVGQREYFEQCSLLTPAGGVEPFFVDHRGGSDPAPVRVNSARAPPGHARRPGESSAVRAAGYLDDLSSTSCPSFTTSVLPLLSV